MSQINDLIGLNNWIDWQIYTNFRRYLEDIGGIWIHMPIRGSNLSTDDW